VDKAQTTSVAVTYRDGLPTCRRSPIHASSNRARCRLTSLIETNSFLLSQNTEISQ